MKASSLTFMCHMLIHGNQLPFIPLHLTITRSYQNYISLPVALSLPSLSMKIFHELSRVATKLKGNPHAEERKGRPHTSQSKRTRAKLPEQDRCRFLWNRVPENCLRHCEKSLQTRMPNGKELNGKNRRRNRRATKQFGGAHVTHVLS